MPDQPPPDQGHEVFAGRGTIMGQYSPADGPLTQLELLLMLDEPLDNDAWHPRTGSSYRVVFYATDQDKE